MIDFNEIDQELQFLTAQSGTGSLTKIQKLSPAAMAALATSLGRKHGVRIEFGDFGTAATDGNTILLPLTSRENSWLSRGFLDHEVSHVRLTDFSLIPIRSAFHKTLWNVLEDIRIEGTMPVLYPGMASNFRSLIRELRETTPGFFELEPNAPPEVVLATYICLMLRALYLKQAEVADLAIKSRQAFISTFGQDLEKDLLPIILRISNAKRPADVLDLVEQIIELLGYHVAESESGQDDAQDEVQDQVQGESVDEEPGDSPDKAQNTSGEDHDSEKAGQTDVAADNAQPQLGDPGNSEPVGDHDNQGLAPNDSTDPGAAGPASPQAAIQQALESHEEVRDFGEQLRDLVQANESQGTFEIAKPATKPDLLGAGYRKEQITASTALVARLSSRLRGLLQSEDLKKSQPGTTGNRIARNRLHRIKTGDSKLFLRNKPEKMVNTAVHLLVDNSTSMDENDRHGIARDVCLALVKSLEPIRGMNLGLTVFPAFYPYHKINGHTVVPVAPVISHDQRPGKSIMYPQSPEGQTPLAAAVRYVASSMLGLVEPRKILVILTDGEPDNEYEAKMAIAEAVDLNIEVMCIGIEEVVCPEIFPRFDVVNSVQDLPEKTFKLFEQLLIAK